MPVYEFICPQHGVFEKNRLYKESSSPATCKECGIKCARILSSCSTHFVGSGFYCVDYKKPDHKGDSPTRNEPKKNN